MTSDVIGKADLGAFTLFVELLEVTIADIARGMVCGYCSGMGEMLAPVSLTEKAAEDWKAAEGALLFVRCWRYFVICDNMRLHPQEVMREAKRRAGNGTWVRTGPPMRRRKYARRPSQKREKLNN